MNVAHLIGVLRNLHKNQQTTATIFRSETFIFFQYEKKTSAAEIFIF